MALSDNFVARLLDHFSYKVHVRGLYFIEISLALSSPMKQIHIRKLVFDCTVVQKPFRGFYSTFEPIEAGMDKPVSSTRLMDIRLRAARMPP